MVKLNWLIISIIISFCGLASLSTSQTSDNNANAWDLAEQDTAGWVNRWWDRYGHEGGGGSCP